jgi:Arc/MetJ-type ribon-helix-helix transcriptional regulator
MKYEEDIRNGLKALLAEADAKTKELNAELKEQKKNAPEAGTSEFLDYEKSCRLLKAQYKLALGKLQFMDDQDKYLAAMRKKRWENRQHGSTAAFFEEYHSQLRYAEELTKLLCALVNEAVALEYGLAVGHDKIRKEGRLKDVTARLGRFEAAIGGNAAARLGLYYDTIANPPPKAVVPEAGSGDEASGDIEEADIAEVSCAELR